MKTFSKDELKSSRYRMLRNKRFMTIANDYLSSISLNNFSVIQNNSNFNNYYDKLMQKDYDCFSKLNLINNKLNKRNDFFIYYKNKFKEQKILNRFENFLKSEFDEKFNYETKKYIDKVLNDLSSQEEKNFNSENAIQSINIAKSELINKIPSIIMTNTKDIPISDSESEFPKNHKAIIKKNNYSSNQLGINSSNITISSSSSASIQLTDNLKLTSSLQNSSNFKGNKNANKFLANELENNQLSSFVGNLTNGRKYQRTVSESSNESNSNYGLLSLNKNINSVVSYKSRHYKPILFNCLRRLNNEKIMFLSNNSTVGLFSRFPFKSNISK